MMPLMIGPELITYPRILFGLGLVPHPDKMTMTVSNAAGSSRRVTLQEEPRASEEGWVSARVEQGPDVPLYLKNLKSNYWFEYVADAKLLFFQYNVVREGEEPLRLFLDRLFRFVNEHDVERFVIDLRWNTGGTRLLNQQLIHRLIRNDKINHAGKLFVVVGRYTFSAGMMLASEIERNTDAVFVGEPTASGPISWVRTWASGYRIVECRAAFPISTGKIPAPRIFESGLHRSSTHRHRLPCTAPIAILLWKRYSTTGQSKE